METSKREKVILGMAIAAVLFAGGRYLLRTDAEKAVPSQSDENAAHEFVMEVTQSIARYHLTETEQVILEKMQTPWPSEPFVLTAPAAADEPASAQASIARTETHDFNFTGYLEMGATRLAIINGEEYATGERISGTSFIVVNISPERVLLAGPENDTRAILMTEILNLETSPTQQLFE